MLSHLIQMHLCECKLQHAIMKNTCVFLEDDWNDSLTFKLFFESGSVVSFLFFLWMITDGSQHGAGFVAFLLKNKISPFNVNAQFKCNGYKM